MILKKNTFSLIIFIFIFFHTNSYSASKNTPSVGSQDASKIINDILNRGYQTELPGLKASIKKGDRFNPENYDKLRNRSDSLSTHLSSQPLKLFYDLIFLVAIVIVLWWFLLWLYEKFMPPILNKISQANQTGQDDGINSEKSSRENKLIEAETLVKQGRLTEAIHIILLISIEWISRKNNSQIPDSLTSREILRHSNISGTALFSFRKLVGIVENVYFGGIEPKLEDYHICVDCYNFLTGTARDSRE